MFQLDHGRTRHCQWDSSFLDLAVLWSQETATFLFALMHLHFDCLCAFCSLPGILLALRATSDETSFASKNFVRDSIACDAHIY
jgi:hypothetical protein